MKSKGHSQQAQRGESSEIPAVQGQPKESSVEQKYIHKSSETEPTQSLEVRKIAGRLKYYSEKWKLITRRKFILNCIKGYAIQFTFQLFQTSFSTAPLLQGSQSLEDVSVAINSLQVLGAIRLCILEDSKFISSYFLVKKSDGTFRFILNLKKLNEFITTKHFKLEDSRTVEKLISKNDFLAKLDLENAYFMIPVDEASSKYLRFIFQDQCFEFLCLHFGLNVAPYIFPKKF